MKRLFLTVLAGVLLLSASGFSQNGTNGALIASSTDCSTAGSCVTLTFDNRREVGVATIEISGTWVATQQFEGKAGTQWVALNAVPSNASTAVTSATANGTWSANVAAYTAIRVRTSAFTSGSGSVQLGSALRSAAGGGAATTTSGTAGAVTQPGYPMMCDSATSGTVSAGQAQMVRCTTAGILANAIIGGLTSDGFASGSIAGMIGSNASILPLGVASGVYNGTTWDRFRTASLANDPTAVTLTARNSIGAALVEKGSRFSVFSNPAAGSQATASIAAEASVRHVADCVSFSGGSVVAPALTALTVNLRDGATGAGTVIWTQQVIISAATGQNVAPFSVCGLNLVGTTNTAMTLEFSAALASLSESATITGFNVN